MSYYKDHDPTEFGGSGEFLKLKDGENIVRLLTEPVHLMTVYMGEGIKPMIVRKQEEIPDGKKESHRFLLYVYDYSEGAIKLAEFPATIINAVGDLSNSSQYSFDTENPPYDIIINKKGEKKETRYSVTPGRNEKPLGKAIMEELKEKEPCEKIKDKRYAEQNPGSSPKETPDKNPFNPNETQDEKDKRIKKEAEDAFDD